MKFKLKKVLASLLVVSVLIPCTTSFAAAEYVGNTNTSIWYTPHVQDIGWMPTVTNGDIGGTTGQAKGLEALEVDVLDSASINIFYQAYVKNTGWTDIKRDGQTVGTTGKGLPLTAIAISVQDKNNSNVQSSSYDVRYKLHVSNIGWGEWVYNGNVAGTENGNNIEAIQIEIRAKGSAPSNKGEAIVAEAYKHIGKPYVWGGKGPNVFDCSGFTSYVYRQNGINIPSYIGLSTGSESQRGYGTLISNISDLQPGDLVITYNYGHVGIYVGNGKYINSPQPGERVKVSNITSFNEGRRIL
ncbi:C40 family peptidase [Clostridium gasigenes]|uniref:NlpC/P60 family protein n=1 Tax=Clostridium gasigenes TaxID=94869 RepID=UPI001C0CDA1F|nr:NlpC/P60 family protein [Clostridium gasigenes]MBU3087449.1 C40 family peptidase [Clostridium gasigenes]